MSTAVQPPQVEIHDVAIDHVNVREPRRRGVRKLRAITPFLTVLIAATSAVFSFGFRWIQENAAKSDTQVEQRLRVDEAWRDALARSLGNGQSATLIALEMETFASDAKYRTQAKSIVYHTLPKIESEGEFDAAFLGALDSTLDEDQDALISVVRRLSFDLEQVHDRARKKASAAATDVPSLADLSRLRSPFLRRTIRILPGPIR